MINPNGNSIEEDEMAMEDFKDSFEKEKILLAALEGAFIALGSCGGNRMGSFWRKEWEMCREAIKKCSNSSAVFNHPSGMDR